MKEQYASQEAKRMFNEIIHCFACAGSAWSDENIMMEVKYGYLCPTCYEVLHKKKKEKFNH
tara:strand:+ start:1491 stop:1673 length:183 start_codon:yes stop_codon:yes gene_type:complete